MKKIPKAIYNKLSSNKALFLAWLTVIFNIAYSLHSNEQHNINNINSHTNTELDNNYSPPINPSEAIRLPSDNPLTQQQSSEKQSISPNETSTKIVYSSNNNTNSSKEQKITLASKQQQKTIKNDGFTILKHVVKPGDTMPQMLSNAGFDRVSSHLASRSIDKIYKTKKVKPGYLFSIYMISSDLKPKNADILLKTILIDSAKSKFLKKIILGEKKLTTKNNKSTKFISEKIENQSKITAIISISEQNSSPKIILISKDKKGYKSHLLSENIDFSSKNLQQKLDNEKLDKNKKLTDETLSIKPQKFGTYIQKLTPASNILKPPYREENLFSSPEKKIKKTSSHIDKIDIHQQKNPLNENTKLVKGKISPGKSLLNLVSNTNIPANVVTQIKRTLHLEGIVTDTKSVRDFTVLYALNDQIVSRKNIKKLFSPLSKYNKDSIFIKNKKKTPELIYFSIKSIKGKKIELYRYIANDGTKHYIVKNDTDLSTESYDNYWAHPINVKLLNSNYGQRFHPIDKRYKMHYGVDYNAPHGSAIKAAADGFIVQMGKNGGFGNSIKIRHNRRYVTLYGHLSNFAQGIHIGSFIKKGQIIGLVGSSGRSTGSHLHFEVHENGKRIDPALVLRNIKNNKSNKLLDKKQLFAFQQQQNIINRHMMNMNK